jgi:hypothetical protein
VPGDPYEAASESEQSDGDLVLIMGAAGFKPGGQSHETVQYVHIGHGTFGYQADGLQVFSYVFGDMQPKLLTVRGRNLLRIYHRVGKRKPSWLRLADRDFRDGDGVPSNTPIILQMTLTDWKRRREGSQSPSPAAANRHAPG